MLRPAMLAAAITAVALAAMPAAAQEKRKTPYWASISAGKALMRTGPGRNFPATWLYQRADLPIEVIEVYPNWRKIRDPGGTEGWMLVNLLSDTRTAIVQGSGELTMHKKPEAGAPVAYRVQPGVVGRISRCKAGWCRLDVKGKAGFIEARNLYGLKPGEELD
ncbi:SH3 domain-containing protein [Allosphingosinicella indica]|uniref:SH3-like domain-containing protein n=1 Tax=Allosphingosinicella indica TaxID=941907 RepID=A0A1X7H230_9SPHN|nr:SH3 domain-containing protein [Allosphingosinicella indica]SMF78492.1 SH3-like domain-containing protein [Allosphingosinicella indica]